MKLLIATKNPGKFSEIAEVLGALPLELVSLHDLRLDDEVEEHGETHEANAVLKARYFYEKIKLPTLGEDSGIYVDAFPGELGVQTRRWEGLHHASDKEWVEYFLKKMSALPTEKRGAKFVCCAALILGETKVSPTSSPRKAGTRPPSLGSPRSGPTRPELVLRLALSGDSYIFSGETHGIITPQLEAPLKAGIPISSCFRPDGCEKVYAALSPSEKNAVSHRGKAMHAVRAYLQTLLP